jgi:hypothetical protein
VPTITFGRSCREVVSGDEFWISWKLWRGQVEVKPGKGEGDVLEAGEELEGDHGAVGEGQDCASAGEGGVLPECVGDQSGSRVA